MTYFKHVNRTCDTDCAFCWLEALREEKALQSLCGAPAAPPAPAPKAECATRILRVYALGAMTARARFHAKCACGWNGPNRQQKKTEVTQDAYNRAAKDAQRHEADAKAAISADRSVG